MYKIDVTMICKMCDRRKQRKVPAATTYRTTVEGVSGDAMLGVCPWCKRQGFRKSLVEAEKESADLLDYAIRLKAYLKGRRPQTAV